MECSVRAIQYAGRPALLGVVRDISGRKRAQKAIQRERDRLQQYLDVMNSMLVALTPDMTITLVNRKACEILGYEESELLGKSWVDT